MFGSAILETAIGLLLIYLLLSLIVSSLQESIEGWLKMRARYLRKGIVEMLSDSDESEPQLVTDLYDHPLIYCLFRGRYGIGRSGKLPSYIPAANFAAALVDILTRGAVQGTGQAAAADLSAAGLRAAVAGNQALPERLQRALLLAIDSAGDDLARVKANIEAWFNSGQEGVSAWFKTYTHRVAFCIGLAAAVGLNVDSVRVARELYRNDALRAATVAEAQTTVMKNEGQPISSGSAQGILERMQLPMGWDTDPEFTRLNLAPGFPPPWDRSEVAVKVAKFIGHRGAGWLMTAIAITLGAPFWFDVLNKMMVIRSTVKPHEKSPEESSEDRQIRGKQVGRFEMTSPPGSTTESAAKK